MEKLNKRDIKQALKVYLVFDKKTNLYTLPMIKLNQEIMINDFDFMTNSPSASTEPTDFELFYVGEYRDWTGEFKMLKKMEFIKQGEVKINYKLLCVEQSKELKKLKKLTKDYIEGKK